MVEEVGRQHDAVAFRSREIDREARPPAELTREDEAVERAAEPDGQGVEQPGARRGGERDLELPRGRRGSPQPAVRGEVEIAA
ncbi:MAG: hypothetical protein NT062_24455 [Proteobacteria bacterium]|nr:hypothetical protein [Pseudomonadota bacterium]